MDYRSQIKEKIGKLLFLEMNIKGFKESIEGAGKSNLYWGAEEAQNALGSLIECMEG